MKRLLLLLSLVVMVVAAFPFKPTLRRDSDTEANCRLVIRKDDNGDYTILLSAKVLQGSSLPNALRDIQKNMHETNETPGTTRQDIPPKVWNFLLPQ